MLTVCNQRVYSLIKDHLNLVWEVESSTEDPLDYTFTIERSESEYGPFEQISEAFSDRYSFRDVVVNLFHKWRQLWYRIKVTKKDGGETAHSDPFTMTAEPNLEALEIRRTELILFREYIGRKGWLFPVRTFGQRCPTCYDPRTNKRVRSQCETCYDTTFVRGYLNPIVCHFQFDPSPKHNERAQMLETQQQNTSARMPNFPTVKPDDIIVEAENRRWRVVKVSSTQRLRAVVHQELVLHEIPPTDIQYRLPINVDNLEDFQPSPERTFSNPHTLEGHTDEDWWSLTLRSYGYSV